MREPVRIYSAVMAGWSVLLAGSAFADLFPPKVYGLLLLLTAAVAAGVGEYTRGKVTPSVAVVARQVQGGPVIAGEAAQSGYGISVGTTVAVDPVQP